MTTNAHLCVGTVPIFAHLPQSVLEQLEALVQHTQFAQGATLYAAGTPAAALYIIHQGQVKLAQTSADGDEHILRVLTPGDFDGDHALFIAATHQASATAMAPVSACVLYQKDFQHLLLTEPALSLPLIQALTQRIETLEQRNTLATTPVGTRLGTYLAAQADTTFTLPMKRQDLARYLGTTPETVSRKMKQFEAAGWLKQAKGNVITILDRHALANQA